MTKPRYRVFVRTWWTSNPDYPNGLEPCAGPKRGLPNAKYATEEEARGHAKRWNANNPAGRFGRRAEIEELA